MRENKTKVIALVALIIAVVGLGIGFAAFSSQLTISSGATVTPNKSDWNVAFDETYNTVGYSCYSNDGATIISNPTVEGTTISGLEVAFSSTRQGMSCHFEVENAGKYRAYLTKMEFIEDAIDCEALEEDDEKFPEGYTRADDGLVASACEGMAVTLQKNPYALMDVATISLPNTKNWTINDVSESIDILNYSIAPEATLGFNFSITYNQNATRADGPFVVRIPDIKLTFNTTPTVQ